MKKLSLKLRLIISFTFMAVTVWMVSAVLSLNESKEQVDEFFDTYQLVLARQFAAMDWKQGENLPQKQIDNIVKELDNDGDEEDEALGFAIFDRKGNMIFNDGKNGRRFKYNHEISGFKNQNIGRKQKTWRIIWMPSADKNYTIAIGQEIDFRTDAAMDMVEETILPWALGLLLLLALTVIMIHHELSPLKKITKELQIRKSDDFTPLSEDKIPSEIIPLVSAVNSLFERIDEMIKHERSFISDAAHELRSPLTALKVHLEVAELSLDDKASIAKSLSNLKIGVERGSRLVEQLLALSKLDNNIQDKANDIIDWKVIISAIIDEQSSMIENKKLSVEYQIADKSFLQYGNAFLCSLMLRNLIDNATRYSDMQADIKINVSEDCLTVTNNKTDIDKQHIMRLGERFFRPSGQKENGSGLGLSIVKKIASIHNCRLDCSSDEDCFIVKIYPN